MTSTTGHSLIHACVAAHSSDGRYGGRAETDSSGTYTVVGLGTATYTVDFTACRAGDYQSKTITGLSVTAGKATTENAVLAPP